MLSEEEINKLVSRVDRLEEKVSSVVDNQKLTMSRQSKMELMLDEQTKLPSVHDTDAGKTVVVGAELTYILQ